MKKTILAVVAVLLCQSVMAQQQVFERSTNESASRSKSANSETSVYRIMVNAVQLVNADAYYDLTTNNFGGENTCVYLTNNGRLVENADRAVPNYGNSEKSDTQSVINQVDSFMNARLIRFIAMAEITKESFPAIQAAKMNPTQAQKYLADQYRKKIPEKIEALKPSINSLPKTIYFEADGPTLGQGGGLNCFSNTGVSMPTVKVVYGYLTKWRMVQGQYNLTWDGINFAINKGGYLYIADGSILGSNLTLGSGSTSESTSGKFQKKNQAGN